MKIKITESKLRKLIHNILIEHIFHKDIKHINELGEDYEDFTSLSMDYTKLPYDILVDSNMNYKRYNNILCLYIIWNDYLYPISISSKPKQLFKSHIPYVEKVFSFIKKNLYALIQYANRNLSSPQFYDLINETLNDDIFNVNEMSGYSPQETGLPVWIWIDENQAFLKSGHNGSYRLKFQQDENISDYRSWIPVLLPSLEIHKTDKIPNIKIKQKCVNKVLQWAELNMDALMLLKDGKIKGNEFRDKYMKPLEGVAVVNPQEKLQYTKIGNQQYGFTIVKSLKGKYNFVNHEDKLLIHNWVDNVNHFINYNGNVIASIQVNNEWFFINKDGKITNIL